MPRAYRSSCASTSKLEKHYRDMQDIEFTIQKGRSGCCRRGAASARRRPP